MGTYGGKKINGSDQRSQGLLAPLDFSLDCVAEKLVIVEEKPSIFDIASTELCFY